METRAALLHQSMAQLMLSLAQQLRRDYSFDEILFSGGVFQNRLLAESAIDLLGQHGFTTCLPQIIPVNDAGISFGQVMECAALQQ
jgi:hydrogenase maturation protein HypF